MAKKILIVDDEDDIREIAQVSLQMVGGWDVVTASSSEEAVSKAVSEQPDAILLDVMMPDKDGPATFKDLQAESSTNHIPVILLTAKVQSSDRQQFTELGVNGVIAKPFDPMTLAQEVANVLNW